MVETLPLVLAAVALFVLPGAAVGWAAGMRVRWALASGVAITPAVWSVLAWAYGEVGVAVSTLSLVCGTVPFILLGLSLIHI